MSYKLNPFTGKLDNTGSASSGAATAIDDLTDVDTSTVAPTNGQVLTWDNTAGKWEPGSVTGSGSLPSGNDGEALIWQNGAWAAGPVIGGYNYTTGNTNNSTYTVPTGFSIWGSELSSADTSTSPSPNITLSGSNRIATATSTGDKHAISTTSKNSGKWYWEIEAQNLGANGDAWIGIVTNINTGYPGNTGSGGYGIRESGQTANDISGTTTSGSPTAWSSNSIVMFALDLDTKKLWQGVNGVWANSGDPAAGTGALVYGWTGTPDFYYAMRLYYNTNAAELKSYVTVGATVSQPYTIDNLEDVDTSTVAPTDGQTLVWDNANSKWEPGTISGGATAIDGLSDVDTTTVAPTDGQALIWDNANSQWEPGTINIPNSIDNLNDVDTSTVTPTDGQALVWDNTAGKWEPGTVSGGVAALNDLTDVDTTTVAPTDGDVLVYDNANTEFVPGVRIKSDTTEAGTGSSAVTNIVTISETDYNALTTPAANTIYFIV